MNYKAYISALNNFPDSDDGLFAMLGFKEAQIDIVFFEDIEEVPKSKYNIVVGGINQINSYLSRFGIEPKQALNIPDELNHERYLKRKVTYTTMGEFRKTKIIAPVFIKPNGLSKEFIAGVMTKQETMNAFNDVADDRPILLSEVIDIVSEYRCYVYDKKLQGIHWYQGDFKIFPDIKLTEEMIAAYKSQPAGFSLDVGVTKDGHTVLVECNDGWALGNYGLQASKYTTLLMKRWMEIFKSY